MAPQYRKGRRAPWMVQVRDETGRTRTKCFDNKEDAELCEYEWRRIRQAIRAGLEKPESEETFTEYVKPWFKARLAHYPASTTNGEESKLRRIWLPRLGQMRLASVRRTHVEPILNELVADPKHSISPTTRNLHRTLLHQIFEDARIAGKIRQNPISDIPILKKRGQKKKNLETWTSEEAKAYLAAAAEFRPVYVVWGEIAFFTGARVSQITALQWRELYFDEDRIQFCRIFEVSSGLLKERTKKGEGEEGAYEVPLFPCLKATLQQWKASSAYTGPQDFVLSDAKGEPLTYWHLNTMHKKIVKKAGIRALGIHEMRAYFANQLKDTGFHDREIQEMLGHEDIGTTEIYFRKRKIDAILSRAKALGFGVEERGRNVAGERLN